MPPAGAGGTCGCVSRAPHELLRARRTGALSHTTRQGGSQCWPAVRPRRCNGTRRTLRNTL
eukprot:14249691-Alexandrium_andersonii.AAC.1